MAYVASNFRGYLSGLGAAKAASLAVTGAITGASATVTGELKGETVWATKTPGAGVLQVKLGDGDSGIGESADDSVIGIAATATIATVASGGLTMAAGKDVTMGAAGQIFADSGTATDPGISIGGSSTGIFSNAATTVNIAIGGGTPVTVNGSAFYLFIPLGMASYIDMYEVAAPAGGTDIARLFAVVDGGSKTDLKVIFQSGAAIIIDQEA